jgi:hypothetical protein
MNDNNGQAFLPPVSKRQRAMTANVIEKQGFIKNALLLLKSEKKSGDYHDETNCANFTKWVREKLMLDLPSHYDLFIKRNLITCRHPTLDNMTCKIG